MITAHYSFSWAASVVQKLHDKYPRATDCVERILHITDRNLAAYLATGDKLFPELRNMVHFVDNAGRCLDNLYTDDELVLKIKANWRTKYPERLFRRLDEIRNPELDFKSSDQGGLPREAKPTEGANLSACPEGSIV